MNTQKHISWVYCSESPEYFKDDLTKRYINLKKFSESS